MPVCQKYAKSNGVTLVSAMTCKMTCSAFALTSPCSRSSSPFSETFSETSENFSRTLMLGVSISPHKASMTCDHCHCQISPGSEQTFWDSVKHCVWVCATCAAFLLSTVTPGQLSPQQEPPPIIQATHHVDVDSGSSGSTLSERYWQQLNAFFVIGQDSDDYSVASLTMPRGLSAPTRPAEEQPTPENQPHPPHEGSIFGGVSASGAMANTNAAMTMTTWVPPDPGYSPLDQLFATQASARRVMLKVGSVPPQHHPLLPRARRNC